MADPRLPARPRADERSCAVQAPIAVGRLAPYPVWVSVALLVRASQVIFLGCIGWYLAALFDAFEPPHRVSTPPLWLTLTSAFLGTSSRGTWRWRTSPAGDTIGNFLASQHCPACGQNVFDHTPPSGFAPESQKHRFFPRRNCTNCGHDLGRRTAS